MAAVIVEFDDVLNELAVFVQAGDLGPPRAGARQFVQALMEFCDVVIVTWRDPELVRAWLVAHDFAETHAQREHPPAAVTVGARALRFDGEFAGLVERVRTFRGDWEGAP